MNPEQYDDHLLTKLYYGDREPFEPRDIAEILGDPRKGVDMGTLEDTKRKLLEAIDEH